MTTEGVRARQPGEVEYGELPELTRTLRALGSPRRSGGAAQQQFFSPLLEARRRAASTRDVDAVVRAFDGAALARALERQLEAIARGWPDDRTAARRALRAEIQERTREYRAALALLDERSAELLAASNTDQERLAAWRAWTTQLAAAFQAADRAWMSISAVADGLPSR